VRGAPTIINFIPMKFPAVYKLPLFNVPGWPALYRMAERQLIVGSRL
jgi:hypothetical protein